MTGTEAERVHPEPSPPPAAEPGVIERVVAWLRAGYPDDVPAQDYVPLLAILRRNLTPGELERVVDELAREAEAGSALTHELVQERLEEVMNGAVLPEDLARVSSRLAAVGWPLGMPLDSAPTPERAGIVARVVAWLRQGYPAGVPVQDFPPLLALLRRRLTDDEVREVSDQLVEAGVLTGDQVDVGAAIMKVTAELPSETDIERVRRHLAADGWPVDLD